jgi:hypothetical protein
MRLGYIVLVLARDFDSAELEKLYNELNLNYNKVSGDQMDKAKSLLMYCRDNQKFDELARACTKIKPDVNWEFAFSPPGPETMKIYVHHIKSAARQYAGAHNYTLSSWWDEFYKSIEALEEEEQPDIESWFNSLPLAQKEVAQSLLATVKETLERRNRQGVQVIQQRKKSWFDKLRGK